MNKNFRIFITKTIYSLAIITMLTGCESPPPSVKVPVTGFLTDYSGLEPTSDTSYRYINPKYNLARYASFIIDPVDVRFRKGAATKADSWDDLEALRAYRLRARVKALIPRYSATAKSPGPGVARIRIALTNVAKSAPFKLGRVSMEAEILDSRTGEQIAAVIESQKKGVPFYGYEPWSGAKAIMDDWAKQLYDRLEEAHGY